MKRRRGPVDPLDDTDRDVDFHTAVAEASHNVALVHVMRGIFNLMRINMLRSREALCHQAENVTLLDEQHAQIAKAIAERDPAAARAASNIHLSFVQASLREAAPAFVRAVEVFDVYRGAGLPEGKKSVAIRVLMQDTERTLADNEIEGACQRMLDNVQQQHGAALRA